MILTWVMVGEPLHKVESSEMTVATDAAATLQLAPPELLAVETAPADGPVLLEGLPSTPLLSLFFSPDEIKWTTQ